MGFAAGCEVPVNSRKVNQKSPFIVTELVLLRDKGRTPQNQSFKVPPPVQLMPRKSGQRIHCQAFEGMYISK